MNIPVSRDGLRPSSPLALKFDRQTATKRLATSGQFAGHIWPQPCKPHRSAQWSAERFDRFCRLRFPASAYLHVAALAAQPAESVRKHMRGAAKPGADAMLTYIGVFGPEFLAAMMPVCDWAARAADDEARRGIHRELARLGERY